MPIVNLQENLRCCIRADGSVEPIAGPISMEQVQTMIAAPDSLDIVNLRQFGLVMCVDDTGKRAGRATNVEATRHYHSVCKPGTTYTIAGDVVIVPDADFAP